MKINGFTPPDALKAYAAQKKGRVEKPEQVQPGKGEDTLVISPQAREIQELKLALKDMKDVRQDRVDQLKKEIAGGSFRVDASKTAEGILRERALDKQVKGRG